NGERKVVQDADMRDLRLLVRDTYHFQPPREQFSDVLFSEADKNQRHPVREYLDALVWDKVPRIDRWLTTYGGAEDTPFNNAIGRIMLVASVRRIRCPGCKFDEIVVWESPQGLNKSTALKILAVREEW